MRSDGRLHGPSHGCSYRGRETAVLIMPDDSSEQRRHLSERAASHYNYALAEWFSSQWRCEVSRSPCAELRWWAHFDFKPKKNYHTFTYNITNQAANLKLSHTITILTNVCDSPNRTIVKCSFACLLLCTNI